MKIFEMLKKLRGKWIENSSIQFLMVGGWGGAILEDFIDFILIYF